MPAPGRGAREMGHRLQAHPSAATPGTTGPPCPPTVCSWGQRQACTPARV